MTASISHCWKNVRLDLIGLLACVCLAFSYPGLASAQAPTTEIIQLEFERAGDSILLTANLKFELSTAIEEALYKGVAMIFVAEADIYSKRWYWTNKRVAHAERHMRLAYQPLTRRWRLNVASGVITNVGIAMALSQNFDSLSDALAAVQRISRWRIADVSELDLEQSHFVEFDFRLDMSQLPRPFQIGTLGETDWTIAASTRRPLIWQSGT